MTTMSASWLMVIASVLFASMGVCVKLASAQYGTGEIVFYRSVMGAVLIACIARRQRSPLGTKMAAAHLWRSLAGTTSLVLWVYALGRLPLSTAVTLNYLSSVWIGVLHVGAALWLGSRLDGRQLLAVTAGFAGVALVLQPSMDATQLAGGAAGLAGGLLAAMAYMQLSALGRAGEPSTRVVFYFSLTGVAAGAGLAFLEDWHAMTLHGLLLLTGVAVFAALGQLLMTRAYSIGRPLVNASLQYLGIIFSALFGVLLFNDHVSAVAVGGMALIVGAGIASSLLQRGTSATDRPVPRP